MDSVINLDSLRQMAVEAISDIKYPAQPAGLYEPVEYALGSGGKHLRPVLCLAACQALGVLPDKALNQALAVEMFHNFTLIHDDLMDGSDTRRGRPTVYAKWGEVQAVLSGDTLLTLATAMVCRDADPKMLPAVLGLFNTTALEVYEGQQYDMDFEDRDDVTVDEYLQMIRLKTSVLLGCACAMGAVMAGAGDEARKAMYDYGVYLGLAFQLRDDWLDTYGDPLVFGKIIGTDIVNRKKTWLFITAMNEAPAEMAKALTDNPGKGDLIAAVTGVYNSLGLSERCDELIAGYCRKAVKVLEDVPMSDENRRVFASLAESLSMRKS